MRLIQAALVHGLVETAKEIGILRSSMLYSTEKPRHFG